MHMPVLQEAKHQASSESIATACAPLLLLYKSSSCSLRFEFSPQKPRALAMHMLSYSSLRACLLALSTGLHHCAARPAGRSLLQSLCPATGCEIVTADKTINLQADKPINVNVRCPTGKIATTVECFLDDPTGTVELTDRSITDSSLTTAVGYPGGGQCRCAQAQSPASR